MLTFSRAQWNDLGQASFDRRVAELIRAQYPAQAQGMPADEMLAFVGRQRRVALAHGLADEQSAATFVLTAWLFGEGFDERIPALAQVLAAPELSAADKARALQDFGTASFCTLAAAR